MPFEQEAEERETTGPPARRQIVIGNDVACDRCSAVDTGNAAAEVAGDGVAFHDGRVAATDLDAAGSKTGRVPQNGVRTDHRRGGGPTRVRADASTSPLGEIEVDDVVREDRLAAKRKNLLTRNGS